jgi:hypothetical protein
MTPLLHGTLGVDHPLLAKYHTIDIQAEHHEALIQDLHQLPYVQTAYRVPHPVISQPPSLLESRATWHDGIKDLTERATGTPDLQPYQRHLLPAEDGGIDALFARANFPGALGDGVQIFDVEAGWLHSHEDLHPGFPTLGYANQVDDKGSLFHGTAVAGIIGGLLNGRGVDGIAPSAKFVASSWFPNVASFTEDTTSTAQAMQRAVDLALPGDVMLLEAVFTYTDLENSPQLTPDWFPDQFDIMRAATAKGLIVVQCAGNGDKSLQGQNLDDPVLDEARNREFPGLEKLFPNPYKTGNPTSGAIFVGAGQPAGFQNMTGQARFQWSNYGSRLDVQAWGGMIVTSSTADNSAMHFPILYSGGPNASYTSGFGGTSGAGAMIAGVIASTQGAVKAKGLEPLTADDFRALFNDPKVGLPQADHPELGGPETCRIGNQPDLRSLIPMAIERAQAKVGCK